MAGRSPMTHRVDITYDATAKTLSCAPELLRKDRPNHVREGDTVTFACDLDNWAVVFGSDSPFDPQVIGNNGPSSTQVRANRRTDPHRHKYVVVAWVDGKLMSYDPEVDVDED